MYSMPIINFNSNPINLTTVPKYLKMVLDTRLWISSYVYITQSKQGTQPIFACSNTRRTVETLEEVVKNAKKVQN